MQVYVRILLQVRKDTHVLLNTQQLRIQKQKKRSRRGGIRGVREEVEE